MNSFLRSIEMSDNWRRNGEFRDKNSWNSVLSDIYAECTKRLQLWKYNTNHDPYVTCTIFPQDICSRVIFWKQIFLYCRKLYNRCMFCVYDVSVWSVPLLSFLPPYLSSSITSHFINLNYTKYFQSINKSTATAKETATSSLLLQRKN
jgi:hypothetical protein